jgi:hypothetical protein
MFCSHLRVSLDYEDIAYFGQVFLPLKQLQRLQHFHFSSSDAAIKKQEMDFVRLCVRHLPKLKTVGRDLKVKFGKDSIFVYYPTNICLRVPGIDCISLPSHLSCQLGLEEFACHGYNWHPDLVHRLPKLKRLHLKGCLHQAGERIPITVTELHLYFNCAPWQFDALSARLQVLTLYNCDLREMPSGGVLAMCPNLEELHLHSCAFTLSDIAIMDMDMSRCRLLKLSLSSPIKWKTRWDGLLCLLLKAPLLEHVQIAMKYVPIAEVQQLVEQVRSGLILQNVSLFQLSGENVRPLQLAVQAFCPKVVQVLWTKPRSALFS